MSRAPIDGFGTRTRQLAAVACLTLAGMVASAADLQLERGRSRCDEVRFGGDTASCAGDQCVLTGAVYLFCDDLKLWADELEITWTPEREFAGAEARGNAILVDGNTVIRCQRIRIDRDRIRGRVVDAIVEIKERPTFDSRGIPTGKNASILRGDIERPSANELRVINGSYTLCDCGADPPSWRIDAPEIEIELGERALIWWPMLYISPFGLGLVPVTPPLLPISVPLKPRAWGFLPPAVTFYGPLPMIDIPFFVPIGESWDLTITPGLRTDWIRNHDLRPSRWGAPRLGGRVRYAPLEELKGELQVQWTWDRRLFVARDYYIERDLEEQMEEFSDNPTSTLPGDFKRFAMLAELEHRVTLNWQQRVEFTDTLRWLTDVEWLSDDNIRQDFGVTLHQQVVNYIPSRTQLSWTPTAAPVGLVASLAADHLLLIGNSQDTLVNYRGAELHTPHRGPAARISLLPTAIAPDVAHGLHVDADATLARYGPWDLSDPADLVLGGFEVGISYMHGFGPLSVRARSSGHGLWAEAVDIGTNATAFLHLEASAEATWARSFGDWIHTVTPRLTYASIPQVRRSAPAVAAEMRHHVDERLDVRLFHQGLVAVEQGIWSGRRSPKRLATLTVGLPLDLMTQDALAVLFAATWRHRYLGRGSAWAVIDPGRVDEKVQELGTIASWTVGPVTVGATYLRFSPTAERFTRSIYALAGDNSGNAQAANWVHSIVPSISLRTERVRFAYSAMTLLPRPNEPEPQPDFSRPLISQHRLTAGYRSPCDCWEIGLTSSIPGHGTAQEILDGLRLQITFSIAGYAIGNRL